MNSQEFLNSAGLWPQKDKNSLWQWRLSAEVQPRIRRFSSLIQAILASPVKNPGALAMRLVCLVCLDGIRPNALSEIGRQGVVPYQINDQVMIEWEEMNPPRTERRLLSRLTSILWPTEVSPSGDILCIATADLVSGLKAFLDDSALYRSLSERAIELERDAFCWWYQCLPAPLFAHQCALQVLSALPRSALARRSRKLAVIHLLQKGKKPEEASDTDLGFTAELIDSASFSSGSDNNSIVLNLGVELMTVRAQEVDGVTKRRWAQGLFDLQSRAQSAGPLTSLLLGWALDLCESGTVGKSNLARSTVRQYVHCAAMPLFEALRLMGLKYNGREWSAEVMHQCYIELMTGASIGNKKTMASALTSFHHFLTAWYDVEPMAMKLHANVPLARVLAQVIWPHEVDLVMTWLELVDDERVRNAGMIMLGVARESSSRTNELLRLRLGNIREECDGRGPLMEIEIARHAIFGRLKTQAAQRRLTIRNLSTIQLIKSWMERRINEGAPVSAFLFGDPNDDARIHRAFAVMSLLNRLLKAATGEPEARIHQLRHGAINEAFHEHLNSASIMDPNRIAITATEAGHVSAVSTFTSYFHVYESSLRTCLDAAHLELIQLNSTQAGLHLSLKSATLRQNAHRKDMKLDEFIWWQLRDIPIPHSFPEAGDVFDWQVPAMPRLLPRADLAVTGTVVLSLLEKLLDCVSTEALSLRYRIAKTSLEKLSENLMSFSLHLARSSWPRRFPVRSQVPVDLRHILDMAEIDLARAHQNKYSCLAKWFSQEQSLTVLRNARNSWLACRQVDYLALDVSGRVLGLYQLLLHAKVDPRDLRLCSQASASAQLKSTLVEDFITVFGAPPRESTQEFHQGRPSAYLQWDGPEHRENHSSASSSIAGLDAWMIVTTVLLSMNERQS